MQTNIPSSIVSGATIEFTKCFRDFTPDLWDLSYHIRGASPVVLDVDAIAWTDPTQYLVTLTASYGVTPTPLPAGQYFFQAYATDVSNTADKRLVDSGRINVLADLSSPSLTTYDGRSNAEIMVAAIDAVMQKKATVDQAAYTIGQRTLTRIPPDQLIEWRKYYAAIVQGEIMRKRIAKGMSPFENILTEFKQP